MTFNDYFSDGSKNYEIYRPRYPAQLFEYIAGLCRHTHTAWDCATGSGQAALSLTPWFQHVYATDASAAQIAAANTHSQIIYSIATAEQSGLADHSIDLITVAQALHWFDIDAFVDEVSRVAGDGAILAVWTYNRLYLDADIDAIIQHLYADLLGDFWPFERRFVESGYADLQLPFTELETPEFELQTSWNLRDLLGYLNTWSAVKLYQREHKRNPVADLHDQFIQHWPEPTQLRSVRWPLTVRAYQL